MGFGKNVPMRFKHKQKVTVIPNIKLSGKSNYDREYNMTINEERPPEIERLKNVNELNKKYVFSL